MNDLTLLSEEEILDKSGIAMYYAGNVYCGCGNINKYTDKISNLKRTFEYKCPGCSQTRAFVLSTDKDMMREFTSFIPYIKGSEFHVDQYAIKLLRAPSTKFAVEFIGKLRIPEDKVKYYRELADEIIKDGKIEEVEEHKNFQEIDGMDEHIGSLDMPSQGNRKGFSRRSLSSIQMESKIRKYGPSLISMPKMNYSEIKGTIFEKMGIDKLVNAVSESLSERFKSLPTPMGPYHSNIQCYILYYIRYYVFVPEIKQLLDFNLYTALIDLTVANVSIPSGLIKSRMRNGRWLTNPEERNSIASVMKRVDEETRKRARANCMKELAKLPKHELPDSIPEGFTYNYSIVVSFTSLCRDFGYNPSKLLSYINDNVGELVYDYYVVTDFIRDLRDYASMVSRAQLNMPKYPKNLEEKHDEVADRFRVKMDEMKRENFRKRARVLDNLEYIDEEKEEYSILVPRTPKDLEAEGKALGHCVGSYADSFANGDTIILFMRKSGKLGESYATIEINKKLEIVQFEGKNRRRSPTKEENEFLEKWKKKILKDEAETLEELEEVDEEIKSERVVEAGAF